MTPAARDAQARMISDAASSRLFPRVRAPGRGAWRTSPDRIPGGAAFQLSWLIARLMFERTRERERERVRLSGSGLNTPPFPRAEHEHAPAPAPVFVNRYSPAPGRPPPAPSLAPR